MQRNKQENLDDSLSCRSKMLEARRQNRINEVRVRAGSYFIRTKNRVPTPLPAGVRGCLPMFAQAATCAPRRPNCRCAAQESKASCSSINRCEDDPIVTAIDPPITCFRATSCPTSVPHIITSHIHTRTICTASGPAPQFRKVDE